MARERSGVTHAEDWQDEHAADDDKKCDEVHPLCGRQPDQLSSLLHRDFALNAPRGGSELQADHNGGHRPDDFNAHSAADPSPPLPFLADTVTERKPTSSRATSGQAADRPAELRRRSTDSSRGFAAAQPLGEGTTPGLAGAAGAAGAGATGSGFATGCGAFGSCTPIGSGRWCRSLLAGSAATGVGSGPVVGADAPGVGSGAGVGMFSGDVWATGGITVGTTAAAGCSAGDSTAGLAAPSGVRTTARVALGVSVATAAGALGTTVSRAVG